MSLSNLGSKEHIAEIRRKTKLCQQNEMSSPAAERKRSSANMDLVVAWSQFSV